MYVSDYGYAASPENWITNLNDYDKSVNYNWMHINVDEWTLVTYDQNIGGAAATIYYIYGSNHLNGGPGSLNAAMSINSYAVRPVFYLNSDVQYVSGTGTQSDPFRIA